MARRRSRSLSQAPSALASRSPVWLRPQIFFGLALIVVLSVAAYWPALHAGFVWDDDELLTANPLVKAPDGLCRLWFTDQPIDYWPMTYTTFWFEWRLWKLNAAGYHITNLALHIVAALLIWAILARLSAAGAFLAALLFAVHPANVESVAWIAQRKNTLALFFFLVAILWYLRQEEERSRKEEVEARTVAGLGVWYWLSLLAFLLAMLSKGSVAILPPVLLGIVWWQRGRIRIGDLLRTAPFFLAAVALAVVNVWFQKHGADVAFRDVNSAQRLAGAGAIVWFYLSKALVPLDLIFVYPQWSIETSDLLWWLPLVAAATVTAMLWLHGKTSWGRPLLFAWVFFCVALLPVMGFTDVYFMKYSLVADHYQYIALIGAMAFVAAGWSAWHDRAQGSLRPLALAAAAIVAGTFASLTFQQCRMYDNSWTLFQATLDKNPTCWMAHDEVGSLLAANGRTAEAMEQYRLALKSKPDHAPAYNNLGLQYAQLGHFDEALENYERALRLDPKLAEAHVNLGSLLLDAGRIPQAIAQYDLAVRSKPRLAEAHFGLAMALARAGHPTDAIATAEQAARLARSQNQTALVRQIETWISTAPVQGSVPAAR